jgi:hypothetical protein
MPHPLPRPEEVNKLKHKTRLADKGREVEAIRHLIEGCKEAVALASNSPVSPTGGVSSTQ